jgi:hypothetical protein
MFSKMVLGALLEQSTAKLYSWINKKKPRSNKKKTSNTKRQYNLHWSVQFTIRFFFLTHSLTWLLLKSCIRLSLLTQSLHDRLARARIPSRTKSLADEYTIAFACSTSHSHRNFVCLELRIHICIRAIVKAVNKPTLPCHDAKVFQELH